MRMLWMVGLAGCWMRAENQMVERELTMDGHLLAAFDAVDAVQSGSDVLWKKSMRALEKGGEVPGVVEDGQLDALHELAASVKGVPAGERAAALGRVATSCADCHRTHGVGVPALFTPENAQRRALGALVFEDEALWTEVRAVLHLSDATAWDARRDTWVAQLVPR